jgi:hypothetical protein
MTACCTPLRVAITGHRLNRIMIGEARISQRLTAMLRRLKQAARHSERYAGRPVAISALAEGADRLFATAALDLRYPLQVLLPFPSADYETTFGESATTPHYRTLLAQAAAVQTLPGRLTDSKTAYEAVGRLTVNQSDILIAVWDGRPAAGRGGTPDIIQYALDLGRPVLWIDAARDRPPRLLRAPTASGRRSISLDQLATRARVIAPRQLKRLVSGG